ncbi:Chitinase 2 [Coemansia biformis]|uniref:chitinase n=1 Tax=Coemansia biformis TaxID=1286918 RepID=A0A9W8CWD7_9FUNG|nr:Chitinase 2 [Coemansia biformis]
MRVSVASGMAIVLAASIASAATFDVSCNSNHASYYGQNSARNQKPLGEYCKDAVEDVIVLAFMDGFPNVLLNFANACETTFEGSTLLHCPAMAKDIKFCQSKGKAVILSMGGASGAYGFASESDGAVFANTVWDMFFKGNASRRPFDDAVLDGIDLDIEGGGSTGYAAFINQLRSHYAGDTSKPYYIAAAPQCPFPDAYLGPTLDSAWFDMVFVQFYNNFCGLNAYPSSFNFGDWDAWAKNKSINKDVKIYIGAPGSPSAASSGYVDGAALKTIYNSVRSNYSSLGGIMTWDVSQARTSGLATSIRAMLDAGKSCGGSHAPSPTNTTSVSTSTSVAATSSSSQTAPGVTGTDTEIYTITTTATETITSVSTFVSTYQTSRTFESTYTLYHTTTYTYTQTGASELAHSSNSSVTYTLSSMAPTGVVPSPEPLSAQCPVRGAPCAELTQGCNDVGYTLCLGGRWVVYPCLAGTKCYLFGEIALCDWGLLHGRRPRCDVQPIQKMPSKSTVTASIDAGSEHRAVFTTKGISSRIEYVPLHAEHGRFSALVKLQTLRAPFGNNWVLRLELPAGQSIDHVDHGLTVANGTSIAIQPNGPAKSATRMFVLLAVSGRYAGPYRMPDMAKASFALA